MSTVVRRVVLGGIAALVAIVFATCYPYEPRVTDSFNEHQHRIGGRSKMTDGQSIDLSGNSDDIARWIWQNLVPGSGQAESVQGEALRAIEKLRWEAQKNGNINWDEGFVKLIQFLKEVLCTRAGFSVGTKASIAADLDRLLHFLPPDELKGRSQAGELPYVEDDLYDRLTERLVEFCREHPEVIPREKDPELLR